MHTEQLDAGVARSVAPNGVVVLSERLPAVRSAALGVWVRTASVHEAPGQMGASHLLEHMVFKGSERRTAHELAVALEERGGSLDAYTSRDNTSFQAHVLDVDLPLAVDVVTDLVRRPLLRQGDLDLERNVILEEIAGVDDSPDDLVFELHSAALWPDHPYGYSILGTPETVSALTAADLRALHQRAYYPGNCVIAAAGAVEHEVLLESLAREGWFDGQYQAPMAKVQAPPAVRGIDRRQVRETSQAHLVLGTDTFPAPDQRRYALSLVVNYLGDGMSSRLFQKVREELGLAYAVFAYRHFYQGTGQLGVYVGTHAQSEAKALDAIRAELTLLSGNGLTAAEVAAARRQLQGQIVLSQESPVARMGRLAGHALSGEPYRTVDEVLRLVAAVTPAEVAAVAAEFLTPERQTVQRLGPNA